MALGATVTAAAEETGLGWTRMADPEGNDFCAFVRPPERLPDYRLHGIGIDCRDARAQAQWWGRLFGSEPAYDATYDAWTLTGVAVDAVMTLDFTPVPEPRTEPNRLHWDVQGDVDDAGSKNLFSRDPECRRQGYWCFFCHGTPPILRVLTLFSQVLGGAWFSCRGRVT